MSHGRWRLATREKITAAQLRKLFVLARQLGMDIEDLRGLAYNLAGADGLSQLTKLDGMRLIDYLIDRANNDYRPHAASRQQWHLIRELAARLGWNEKRLSGFVRRTAGVESGRWLDAAGAWKVIEGLKEVVKREDKRRVAEK
jgi:hypothetical protein